MVYRPTGGHRTKDRRPPGQPASPWVAEQRMSPRTSGDCRTVSVRSSEGGGKFSTLGIACPISEGTGSGSSAVSGSRRDTADAVLVTLGPAHLSTYPVTESTSRCRNRSGHCRRAVADRSARQRLAKCHSFMSRPSSPTVIGLLPCNIRKQSPVHQFVATSKPTTTV